jgi:formyltetrahydrofolate-dependent phosphoribosylglycinamide formyltransferase
MPTKLGVLLSGSGRTLENFFEKIDVGELPVEIAVVIGSRRDAYGLVRAQKRDVPTRVIRLKDYPDDKAFSQAITQVLLEHGVQLVALAGFMHFYYVPEEFRDRVINIHPALIPAFCGKGYYGHHVHEAVVKYGVKLTGCTVHFADNVYDHGPVILQRPVPVYAEDTPDDLAARVFEEEKKAFPEAIKLFCEGRLRVEGRVVRILPPEQAPT